MTIFPIFQIWKFNLKKIEALTQSYTACMWWRKIQTRAAYLWSLCSEAMYYIAS